MYREKGITTMAQDEGRGGKEQDALYYGGQTGSKYGLCLIPRHRPMHYGLLEYKYSLYDIVVARPTNP